MVWSGLAPKLNLALLSVVVLVASNSASHCARRFSRFRFYSSPFSLAAPNRTPHSLFHMSATMGNQSAKGEGPSMYKAGEVPPPKVTFTEEELKDKLSPEEYDVTQNKGTERAWTGKHVNLKEDGTFACVVCGTALFKTDKKFESGSGWPSFSDVAEKGNVHRVVDESFGMKRVEVVCAQCGAHLGHVFEDGPQEDTGLRYCINSASLNFKKEEEEK